MAESAEICLDSGYLKNLTIPSTELLLDHVVYNIEVCLEDYSWTVQRRYSAFDVLHEKLLVEFPYRLHTIIFPSKKWFGNFYPSNVEKRRQSLEIYLQNIVSKLEAIPRILQIFLEFHIYDVLGVTQTLAEELYQTGDQILAQDEIVEVTSFQLYCISKRLKLPIPTCGNGYHCDVGNLYDIVCCLQHLKIIKDETHNMHNLSDKDISFDLSIFKKLKNLEISKCNIDSLQGTFHLQQNLEKLVIHHSLYLFKDILIDQDVWTHEDATSALGTSPAMTWKHLKEINFSHNSIAYIDESVTLLHDLVRLNLSYNNIKEISHLQDLPNLQELDLSFNNIDNLQSANTKLGNIASLRLAGNKLTNVGDLYKLFSLVNLDLSENDIKEINDVMCLAHLPCLENLILLANPVRHKPMYRLQMLVAFEDAVSRICLDKTIATEAEISDVMKILAEEDLYEIVNVPNTTTNGQEITNCYKKSTVRKVKVITHDLSGDEDPEIKINEKSLATMEPTISGDGQDFRDRVEKIRRLGGDCWLGLLNEIQNDSKESAGQNTIFASRPTAEVKSSELEKSHDASEHEFGFSPELEDLVNLSMEREKNTLTGTFFVRESGDDREDDIMVGVDLTKGLLTEIIVESGEVFKKHNLSSVSRVNILETSDGLHVQLVKLDQNKKVRCHDNDADIKYHMRTIRDAAELFALLYKFVSQSEKSRSLETSGSFSSATSHEVVFNDVTSVYSNPIGLPSDELQRFLNDPFARMSNEALHEATGDESVKSIFWLNCLPYALPEHELPVCLVITSLNLYMFHLRRYISSPKKSKKIEKIFSLLFCGALDEISYVSRGIFDLTFRLEYSLHGPHGTFTFLSRDSNITEMFIKSLHAVMASSGLTLDMRSHDVESLQKLKRELAMSSRSLLTDEECILVYAIVREITCRVENTTSNTNDPRLTCLSELEKSSTTSRGSKLFASTTRSLVLTNWNIFLCEEDHLHWPLPSYARGAPSTPQWVVAEHEDIKHVIGIEIYDVMDDPAFVGSSGLTMIVERSSPTPERLRSNEPENSKHDTSRGTPDRSTCGIEHTTRETRVWNVIFKLREEREQFQRSLSQIWSSNFHGKLQVTESMAVSADAISHTTRCDVTQQFFLEGVTSWRRDSLGTNRKCHRRNASGQFNPAVLHPGDAIRESIEVLRRRGNADVLQGFFNDTLRNKCSNPSTESIVCYAWTGCVAYTHPAREIHVCLILSASKIYIVASNEERVIFNASLDVIFQEDTKLCLHLLPLATIRQVCVGFFDQTFRLETDDPENTFTFITRDYQVTSCFVENLKRIFKEIGTEPPAQTKAFDSLPSIYDNYPSFSGMMSEQFSTEEFHHSIGVVKFVYPNDDCVEILKHSILEYGKGIEAFKSLDIHDINILLYLLMFQVIDEKKLPRTFIVLGHALCMCIENHVNFPLPLFVKGLPAGSRYDVQHLRLITDIDRIEFSGFNANDFTIVYRRGGGHEEPNLLSGTYNEEDRWHMIAQTYEEREKALGIILRFWKENFGKDLPVVKL